MGRGKESEGERKRTETRSHRKVVGLLLVSELLIADRSTRLSRVFASPCAQRRVRMRGLKGGGSREIGHVPPMPVLSDWNVAPCPCMSYHPW